MSILSVMFPSGLSQLFWWQRTLEFTIRVLIESHKKLSELYVVKLRQKIKMEQYHEPQKGRKHEYMSAGILHLSNYIFFSVSKRLSPKFCRTRVGQHLLKWDCRASPEASSHFCAATKPGKVWHLLVITRHIFKLWKHSLVWIWSRLGRCEVVPILATFPLCHLTFFLLNLDTVACLNIISKQWMMIRPLFPRFVFAAAVEEFWYENIFPGSEYKIS